MIKRRVYNPDRLMQFMQEQEPLQVVSFLQIYENVFGAREYGPNNVSELLHRLRKKGKKEGELIYRLRGFNALVRLGELPAENQKIVVVGLLGLLNFDQNMPNDWRWIEKQAQTFRVGRRRNVLLPLYPKEMLNYLLKLGLGKGEMQVIADYLSDINSLRARMSDLQRRLRLANPDGKDGNITISVSKNKPNKGGKISAKISLSM